MDFLIAGDIAEVRTGSGETATYRIFANRATPGWESELPAIFVYTAASPAGSESADVNERPTIYKRVLKVSVEIIAEATDTLDDTLDDIAEKVEQVIGDFQNKFAHQSVFDKDEDLIVDVGIVDLTGTDIGFADDGKQIVGSCKLNLDVPYYAGLGIPQDTGEDAEKVHSKFNDSTDTTRTLAETEQDLAPVEA